MKPHTMSNFTSVLLSFYLLLSMMEKSCNGIIHHFFSRDDLIYTFGSPHLEKIPKYTTVYPKLIEIRPSENSTQNTTHYALLINLEGVDYEFPLKSVTRSLLGHSLTMVQRNNEDGGGRLEIVPDPLSAVDDCHFHHESEHTLLSVSNCDNGNLQGIIMHGNNTYVIHSVPQHLARRRKSNGLKGMHVLYKRDTMTEGKDDFCGIENTISTQDLVEDEAGVHEDPFVIGYKLAQESDLIVELAIFADEMLWRHFSSKYGSYAYQKLQQYALTMLSNIQIMYKQPGCIPAVTFRIVRYEVFQTQPSAIAGHLHSNGHAQEYLDRFCRYQRSLGVRDWDHALLLTGYDIHRGYGSNSISGIARLDGMCDPWNTCTLAEGLDFTSAFIGTHEIGHSLGMRHDEPYCDSRFIMSASLGPGKVTWSTCSLRDYHSFVQRLDSRQNNCLRTALLREKLPLAGQTKPGQAFDANSQCQLMHGSGYNQITPRQDHYDGICHMMWCGQSSVGRIITSHPALEGTVCGPSKWCQLGRCVSGGYGAQFPVSSATTTQAPQSTTTVTVSTTTTRAPPPRQPKVDGGWSLWTPFNCQSCKCGTIIGSIGITLSQRTCTNPAPANGGEECRGHPQRAAICMRRCPEERENVSEYISNKCAEHKRIRKDQELTGNGSQLSRFPSRACKVFCDINGSSASSSSDKNYRFYGDNLPDGAPCGFDRFCLNGECTDVSCNNSMLMPREVSDECPQSWEQCALSETKPPLSNDLKGEWGPWTEWSACSATCGSIGVMMRSRTCTVSNRCEGEPNETKSCNRHECSQQGNEPQWSEWTSWNLCSVSCGQGTQARYRRCLTAINSVAFSCPGKTMELRNCEEMPCPNKAPTNSGYDEWGPWSSCSQTCGPGSQQRVRNCKREPCDGPNSERKACNLGECNSNSSSASQQWNSWGEWSECSKVCGGGVRSRNRFCPSGTTCPGPSAEKGECNTQECTTTSAAGGIWSLWSAWGPCSVTCGTGVRRRSRHCQSGQCAGEHNESEPCVERQCPTASDSRWGGWGYWSQCSETCGRGFRRRIRKCYGSGVCPGSEYEREECVVRQTC